MAEKVNLEGNIDYVPEETPSFKSKFVLIFQLEFSKQCHLVLFGLILSGFVYLVGLLGCFCYPFSLEEQVQENLNEVLNGTE
jgi:hypothetical protein